MLDERKLELVILILSGENKTNISKRLNISRQTVYDWLQDPEVEKEISNRRDDLIQAGKEKLSSRLETYLEVLHKLATSSTDKRTQASCAMYLTDRILGKVSTSSAEISSEGDKSVSVDILEKEFEEVDREEQQLKAIK